MNTSICDQGPKGSVNRALFIIACDRFSSLSLVMSLQKSQVCLHPTLHANTKPSTNVFSREGTWSVCDFGQNDSMKSLRKRINRCCLSQMSRQPPSFFVIALLIPIAAIPALTSCTYTVIPPTAKGPAKHAVLQPGQVLEFKNSNGSGAICYVSDFVRTYDIFGERHTVQLMQRTSKFRRLEGIYNPGQNYSIGRRPKIRFVVDESIVHFDQADQIGQFLQEGSSIEQWVCNSDGYVVGHFFSPSRNQVNISLYRIFLNGKPVKSIPNRYRHSGYVRLLTTQSRDQAER